MDFTGKLIHIGEVETYTATSTGNIVHSREIVLQTDEQYPRTGSFTLFNEDAQNFSRRIGEYMHVSFDLSANSNKEGTRYFNRLKVWRIS
jgi:hypothetical protein